MMTTMRLFIFITSLVLVLEFAYASPKQICGNDEYRNTNGCCQPCPNNCETCISDTNCTTCKRNRYYGRICQYECEQCKHSCQQKYGYCTDHGCIDGEYFDPVNKNCTSCPVNCTLCTSATECRSCRHGSYGNTCKNPCASNCFQCAQKNGSCEVYGEGSYDETGLRRRCPEGCVLCHDYNNCHQCKEGYEMSGDRQCFRKCHGEEKMTYYLQTDRNNYGILNDIYDCVNTGDNQLSFITTTPCIRSMPCPHFSAEDNYTGTCASTMMHECIHKCQSFNGSHYQCEQQCSTENRNLHSVSVRYTTGLDIFIGNVSTKTACLPASGDTDITSEQCWSIWTLVILAAIPAIGIPIAVRKYYLKRMSSLRHIMAPRITDPHQESRESTIETGIQTRKSVEPMHDPNDSITDRLSVEEGSIKSVRENKRYNANMGRKSDTNEAEQPFISLDTVPRIASDLEIDH